MSSTRPKSADFILQMSEDAINSCLTYTRSAEAMEKLSATSLSLMRCLTRNNNHYFLKKSAKRKEPTMTKEDLIRKLTSRKFASALLAFITAVLVAFNMPENQIAQVVAIVGSFMTLISYILAEGQIDVAAINGQEKENPDSQKEEEEEL